MSDRGTAPEFPGQGVGSIGGLRVAVCPTCHALVLYHSWRAHWYWHQPQSVTLQLRCSDCGWDNGEHSVDCCFYVANDQAAS